MKKKKRERDENNLLGVVDVPLFKFRYLFLRLTSQVKEVRDDWSANENH